MVEDPVKPIEDHGLRETQVVELAMSVSAFSIGELAESHVDAATHHDDIDSACLRRAAGAIQDTQPQ